MDVEEFSRSITEEAANRARAALLRRRPDLARRRGKPLEVPGEVALDSLAYVRDVADHLLSDMTALVFEARRLGASWARVGLALQESPQTAFNRYRHLERAGTEEEVDDGPPRRRLTT